jgi:hypothetical protein
LRSEIRIEWEPGREPAAIIGNEYRCVLCGYRTGDPIQYIYHGCELNRRDRLDVSDQ